MQNKLVILVAMAIGYAFGWYQFSYSNDAISPTKNKAQESAFVDAAPEEKTQKQSINQSLAQVDSETISNTIDNLAKIENINYTDIAGLVLSPTVEKVSSIIDNMSESEIRLALSSVTTFGDEELSDIEDPSSFAKRLLTAALFKEDRASNSSTMGSIEFGTSVSSDNRVEEPETVFETNTEKLYASFSLKDPAEKVFVKWFQNAPYKVKLFNKYSIDKAQKNNYVWYKPEEWAPGLYTVEVYKIDSDLTVLASSSFRIDE